ncbi:MAG TPA: phosphoenolpyruvate--protein phosphotransferase [Candidatus Limnocylindria bacterium]|nr:phosphoenolpyruvate--protein phosphotransferase [Candidatus Limnocylindria bacterium]
MKRLQGIGASPGVVRGPWLRIDAVSAPTGGRIEPGDAMRETQRLHDATVAASAELEEIAARVEGDGHPEEGAIFRAQASIARDPALVTLATGRIDDHGEDAVAAVQAAADSFADQLRSLDDEVLSARAADVIDVGQRIARRLSGIPDAASATGLDRPTIVVAADLPPSVTATLPRERLLGIALEGSSPTAHAAILARAYGIPAVVGVGDLLDALGPASEIAIDGGTGAVVIDPDTGTAASIDAATDRDRQRHDADLREAGRPAVTSDGVEVALLANIGGPDESESAIELGADGVGLFRTEFLFLERSLPPSEEEQAAAYERVVRAFAPRPVTVRLLDVGGDKAIPYLPIAPEANPFLGVRALRLADVERGLFVTQLRACYRAATAGRLKVMAPMVADAGDVDLLHELAEQARRELAAESIPIGAVNLGVMLEIPSSVLVSDAYFGRIGFASLGTNDLLQYTVAVDRTNPRLERYRDPLHPAVLRLVRMAVDAGDRAGIEISVCGEMAGDPVSALALVGLGVRSLSMAASGLPAVRRAIRGAHHRQLSAVMRKALGEGSAAPARARLGELVAATP